MSGKSYINDQNYFKSNYSEALEYIVPKYVIYDDKNSFGEAVDVKDQIINSHIDIANNISSILNIFSIPSSVYSSINSFNGISKYFIKQNQLSEITAESFYRTILRRVDVDYSDFDSSASFKEYLIDTLLPSIELNSPTLYFLKGDSFSSVHTYLIDNISWLYFLNTIAPVRRIRSEIADLIASKFYFGKSISLNDCLKLLSDYIWFNNLSLYYPPLFASSNSTYTSGTQQLEKLKTWIDIIYSPLYSDRSDYTVKDRFDVYRENLKKIQNKTSNGPVHKLLKAMSLGAYDINDSTEKLKSLTDIEDCPQEYLPFMADLIGWNLFGSDPQRWRLQLRNATDIYKKSGTKQSIQFAVNSVFPADVLDIKSDLGELWESYIPHLIYYSLATESPYFKSNDTWTRELSEQMSVGSYSYSSIDENIKLAVDRIILELYSISSLSSTFNFPSNLSGYFYRGREYSIPPFEEIPYYQNIEIDEETILYLVDRLVCFGVSKSFANKVADYIRQNTIEVDDIPRSNSWLFFTSGYNEPPNIGEIVSNINNKNFEYVSLWSGKSSHFKLDLNAQDFDFSIIDEKEDSGEAAKLASQIVNEFAPAHAIPLINLNLSTVDEVVNLDNVLPKVILDKPELTESSRELSNYEISALYVSSYKRSTGIGKDIQRSALETTVSPELRTATAISTVPRNSLRRRSYEKIMPFQGYYDRSGFNMPVSLQEYDINDLKFIPLGFSPSSLEYVHITDYKNIPAVYSECENLDSSSVFNGISTSSTYPIRGWSFSTFNRL